MKYSTAQNIIDAFNTQEGKDEFLIEWNNAPVQKETNYLKTIRYQVIEGYFNEVEGYEQVLSLLEDNNISLLRNKDWVYALNDENVTQNKIEELTLFSNSIGLQQREYHIFNLNLETEEGKKEKSEKEAILQKISDLFMKHPKLFGKFFEANITYCAYAINAENTFLKLIKNSTQAPYSAPLIQQLFERIAYSDNKELYRKIKETNPQYIKEINKTAFSLNSFEFPKSLFSFTMSKNNVAHNIRVNFLAFAQQAGDEQFFSFLVKEGDFSTTGAVQSCYKDVIATADTDREKALIKQDWKRNRYNLYKTEGEKHSRTFTPNKNVNLLFNVFSKHLDQNFEPEDYDKPYNEIKQNIVIDKDFKAYLAKSIVNGTFISQLLSDVPSWHSDERGKVHLKGDYNSQGTTSAIKILLQIKNAREIIYGMADKILLNEKDSLKKSIFFNHLISESYFEGEFEPKIKRETFNPLWEKGKNLDNEKESISYVLEKYIDYIPKELDKKELSSTSYRLDSTHHLSRMLESSHKEKEIIAKAMIELSLNEVLTNPEYIYQEHNILDNKIFKIILKSDLSFNGKYNPFEFLLENNKIANQTNYFSNDEEKAQAELKYLGNNENKNQQYSGNLSKLVNQAIKNKTIFIPIKNNSDPKNVIATALDKANLSAFLFIKSLSKFELQKIISGDLYFEDANKIYKDIKDSLFESLMTNVILKEDAELDSNDVSHKMLEDTIGKLHELNFDFSIDVKSDTDINNMKNGFKFIKLFTVIKNKDLLTKLYNKYESSIHEIINEFALKENITSRSESEFMLNSLQNKELFNLFMSKVNIEALEPIFSYTNSNKLYSLFLENTHYNVMDKGAVDYPIFRAMEGNNYKVSLEIIENNPETISLLNKNKKTVLEIAIKDSVSFSKKDGKYYSPKNQKDAIQLIKHVIYSEQVLCKDSKSLSNIITSVEKNSLSTMRLSADNSYCFSQEDMALLSKKIISTSMNIVEKKQDKDKVINNDDNCDDFKI